MLTGLLCAVGAMLLNSVRWTARVRRDPPGERRRPLIAQPRYLGGLVFAVQAVLGATIALTVLAARV
jgi:hypothetical protein